MPLAPRLAAYCISLPIPDIRKGPTLQLFWRHLACVRFREIRTGASMTELGAWRNVRKWPNQIVC